MNKSQGERIRLARQYAGLSQDQLANALGLESRVSVSNWENDKNNPEVQNFKGLARETKAPLAWLLGDVPFEDWPPKVNTSQPALHQTRQRYEVPPSPTLHRAPMLDWQAVRQWVEGGIMAGTPASTFPVPIDCGPRTFVMRVASVSNEPMLRDGEFAFVDPDRTPEHRDLVVVDSNTWPEPKIRQFIKEGSALWLRPASPTWGETPLAVSPDMRFLGTVIFIGRNASQSLEG